MSILQLKDVASSLFQLPWPLRKPQIDLPNYVLLGVGATTAGVTVLYIYGTWNFSILKNIGVPGPKPKPLIGNALDVIDGTFGSYDLECKQKYGNVFGVYEGRTPTIVCFDTDLLKEVFVRNFASFHDHRFIPVRGSLIRTGILESHGANWKRMRSIITPFFSSGKMRQQVSVLQTCTETLVVHLDKLAASGEPFEAKDVMGAFTMDAIASTAFGLQVDSQTSKDDPFITQAKKMVNINLIYSIPLMVCGLLPFMTNVYEFFGKTMFPPGMLEFFVDTTMECIRQRKKTKRKVPDFVQALLQAQDEEVTLEDHVDNLDKMSEQEIRGAHGKGMTDTEIAANGVTFFLAGYDTTASTLTFLLYLLATHPEVQDRVVAELQSELGEDLPDYENVKSLKYLEMCVDETLRIYPAIHRSDRMCNAPCTIGGIHIPKGVLFIMPIWAIHHDPEFWPDPYRFDPERFSPENKKGRSPYTHIPFGIGPRQCVGMRLAWLEVMMAATRVLQRFQLVVDEKTKQPLELMPRDPFPKVVGGVWLRATPRHVH